MRRNLTPINLLLAATLSLGATQSQALTEMSDDSLSNVQGAGLAFTLDDFRFQMAPTSYIEQIGDPPSGGTVFRRGDLRWLGLTISGSDGEGVNTGAGLNFNGNACDFSQGLNGMGCAMSSSGIANYANHNNPFLLRVFDYTRVGWSGSSWVGDPVTGTPGTSSGGITRTLLELLGPSNMDTFRWSFWGNILVSDTDPSVDLVSSLQNQNIINGKAAARVKPPSIFGTNDATNPMDGPVLRLFQNQTDNSLGLTYASRLSGDYRFSVNQSQALPDVNGVPLFSQQEGLYFNDVNAYLPLGALHYQSIILDDIHPGSSSPGTTGDGNFVIELTRLPNDSNAYEDAYSIAGANGYQRTGRNDRYYQTHGYVEWGSGFPTCSGANCMSGTGVSNVRFSGSGAAVATTVTLPARVVNSQNFPNDQCTSGAFGGYGGCDAYRGDDYPNTIRADGTDLAVPVTVNYSAGTAVSSSASREDVVKAGGIAFVSRDSTSTWTVLNNPNDKQSFINALNLRNDVMRARTDTNEINCGFACTDYELYGDQTPDVGTIQNAANNIRNNYSSMITVNAINLGTARIEGLLVQHLKITSLGAQ